MEDTVALSQIIRYMYALHEEIKTSLKLSNTSFRLPTAGLFNPDFNSLLSCCYL